MKKIVLILMTCLLLVACNNEKNTNENDDKSMDTSLIDQRIEHQEELDELNEMIEMLKDEIKGMSSQPADDLKKALDDLDQVKIELGNMLKTLEEKNLEVEVLIKEKASWISTNDASTNDTSQSILPNWNISILNGNSSGFNYILEDLEEAHAQRTYVLGEGDFLDLMRDEGPRASVHLGEGIEVSAFEIYGRVYNLTWAEIVWSDDYSTYEIGEIIESIHEISDTTVYVHAMLAETLPYQVVYFENSQGVRVSQTLSYDGYGVSGNVLIFE